MSYTISLPIIAFSLISFRIAGMATGAPFISLKTIPVKFRGAFVIVFSWFFLSILKQYPEINNPFALFLACTSEFIIGFVMGFILNLMVEAIKGAGQLMAMEMGFAFSNMLDPSTGEHNTIIAKIFGLFALMSFILLDGHLKLIEVLAYSFKTAPPGNAILNPNIIKEVIGMGNILFETAVRMALPITGAVLLTQVAIAIAAKMAPRLNVFIMGFAIMILIGLIVVPDSLPYVQNTLDDLLNRAFEVMSNMVLSG